MARNKDLTEVPLAGYTDRLSARPGDTVRFHLSAAAAAGTRVVRARLTYSISADPNPKGQGIVEKDASEYFQERTLRVHHQPIPRGSFAQTNSRLSLTSLQNLRRIDVEIWFFPTLIPEADSGQATTIQNIWSWGTNLALDLLPTGQLRLLYTHCNEENKNHKKARVEVVCTSSEVLKDRRWYNITSMLELPTEDTDSMVCRIVIYKNRESHNKSASVSSASNGLTNHGVLKCIDGPFILASGGSLNGRLEDPSISLVDKQEGNSLKRFPFASWSMSSYYSPKSNGTVDPWIIPFASGLAEQTDPPEDGSTLRLALTLHNHPTRGVKGRLWDGTEFCWKHCPEHYGAIHFHDDDVYDFQWKPDMEWTIPRVIPSGIYVMRFMTADAQQHEEALPLFICAPKRLVRKNRLVLLIPTFTYVMYGNHARPDFEPDLWLARTKSSPGSYPHNPVLFPAYGHSSYDFHADGTGIRFASHLRPLFNLRPGYITFSRTGGFKDDETTNCNSNDDSSMCSGLRHFPADSHIVSWLHMFGYDFDVITDHELHREGVAAIEGYSTLMTCTHPEYHTPRSLQALQDFRDNRRRKNLVYLGGNGFYWKIAASSGPNDDDSDDSSCKLLEIRRSEGGVRTWAAEAGEYYNLLDGMYGGLWKNSNHPPSCLVGISFSAQGSFVGKPFRRTCWDRPDVTDWVFAGISETILGNFGYSGGGAAGYELDRIDPNEELVRDGTVVILARAGTDGDPRYALVPEEVLTPWTNLAGTSNEEAKRADMVYFCVPKSGSRVFSVGSITFCGCLPYNNFDNPVSKLVKNVVDRFLEK